MVALRLVELKAKECHQKKISNRDFVPVSSDPPTIETDKDN